MKEILLFKNIWAIIASLVLANSISAIAQPTAKKSSAWNNPYKMDAKFKSELKTLPKSGERSWM